MTDLGDHPLLSLVLAQLAALPILAAAAAFASRRHPARAHAIVTAGLLATLLAPPLSLAAGAAGLGLLPALDLGRAAAALPAPQTDASAAPPPAAPGLAAAGAAAWTLAAAALAFRLARGLRRGARLARAAPPLRDPRAADALERVLRRTRSARARRAILCRSAHLESPAIFCWSRPPRILLPATLAADAEPRTLEQMLAHEIAHLERRDHWWRLVAEIAVCLVPWHPLVWLLRRTVHETSEIACDARVLRGDDRPDRYAEALLRLAPCRAAPLSALHAVRASTRLARRLRAILGAERPRDRSGRAALATIVAAATAVTAAAALAQRRPLALVPDATAPLPRFAVRAVPGELDLGIVAPGALGAGSLRLVNVGTRAVTVRDQKAACGCTTVEPVAGRTIAPGAALEVPITLAAPDTPATEHRRQVTFFFEETDPLAIHVRLRTRAP